MQLENIILSEVIHIETNIMFSFCMCMLGFKFFICVVFYMCAKIQITTKVRYIIRDQCGGFSKERKIE